MSEKDNKGLERLEELIRIASNHLLTKEEKIGYITEPGIKQTLYGKFPECFISLIHQHILCRFVIELE